MLRGHVFIAAAGLLIFIGSAYGVATQPSSAEALEQAKSLYRQGRFEDAAAALREVTIRLQQATAEAGRTELADAHFYLGLCHFALEDREAARRSFVDALRLMPGRRLDANVYAPAVIELFEDARSELARDAEVPRSAPPESQEGAKWPYILGGAGAAGGVGAALAAGGGDESGGGIQLGTSDRDADGDGFAAQQGDCNDANASVHPNASASIISARVDLSGIEPLSEGLRVSGGKMICVAGTTSPFPTNTPRQCSGATGAFSLPIRLRVQSNNCNAVVIESVEVEEIKVSATTGGGGILDVLPFFNVNVSTAILSQWPSETDLVITVAPRCPAFGFDSDGLPRTGRAEFRSRVTINTASGQLRVEPENTYEKELISCLDTFAARRREQIVTRELNWRSLLDLPSGSARVVFNDGAQVSIREGHVDSVVRGRRGANMVSAVVMSGEGKPGLWRFDFEYTQGFERGSLRVLEGTVVDVEARALVFRVEGKPGERLRFAFRSSP